MQVTPLYLLFFTATSLKFTPDWSGCSGLISSSDCDKITPSDVRRWGSQKPWCCFFSLYKFFSPALLLHTTSCGALKQRAGWKAPERQPTMVGKAPGIWPEDLHEEPRGTTHHSSRDGKLETRKKELIYRLEEIRPGLHTWRRLLLCKPWKPTISDVEAFQRGKIKRRLGAVQLIGHTFILKSSVRTVNERSRPTTIPADTYFHPHNPQQCGASVH